MHTPELDRRRFLARTAAVGAVPWLTAVRDALADAKTDRPTVLLRSGWQTVNIGDITHTPGVLHVLRTHLPDVRVKAWLNSMDRGVDKMLAREFPDVELTTSQKVAESWFDESDLMLHGSGPSVVAKSSLDLWRKKTGKPYGTLGVTIGDVNDWLADVLNDAAFIYTRETHSFDVLAKAGVTKPVIGFAPDGTIVFPTRDDATANKYMAEHGLEPRKFICVIPRLRWTPYHKIKGAKWSAEKIRHVETTNEQWKEIDHEKQRVAMIRWVRETGNKVFVCPEMTYQLDIMDELLIDPLPDDVKKKVVKRTTYWLPDEAASVYRQAHTIISAECHSPLIAYAQGTPAFYVRQPTDTIKGQMYYDFGLTDWVFEVDDTKGEQIADQLMKVHADYDGAKATLAAAMKRMDARYREATGQIAKHVGAKAG